MSLRCSANEPTKSGPRSLVESPEIQKRFVELCQTSQRRDDGGVRVRYEEKVDADENSKGKFVSTGTFPLSH